MPIRYWSKMQVINKQLKYVRDETHKRTFTTGMQYGTGTGKCPAKT